MNEPSNDHKKAPPFPWDDFMDARPCPAGRISIGTRSMLEEYPTKPGAYWARVEGHPWVLVIVFYDGDKLRARNVHEIHSESIPEWTAEGHREWVEVVDPSGRSYK